ncbi:MAG: crossover junction endodeoxyribonuclease RuvC [Candidatus Spechtbacterales bacterium]
MMMSRASTPTRPKVILGIDPGTTRMGFGIIEAGREFSLVTCGIVSASPGLSVPMRLREIHEQLTAIIATHKPEAMGVEDLFFTKNQKTAIDVAAARGVALLAGAQANIPTFIFTPPQIKQAVTGWGQADKKQVQHMVKLLLRLEKAPSPDDAADAVAVAICCAQSLPVLSFDPDKK